MSERYMLEPVGWQFYQDGKWWNGDDQIKDHRKNTEEAGFRVRDVYATPQPELLTVDVLLAVPDERKAFDAANLRDYFGGPLSYRERDIAFMAWQARSALVATHPTQHGLDARDAAFEAVRKAFCNLQRYSFCLDSRGNVRRCADRSGNWVEFEAAHTLFEPQSVDAALAAQAKQGGAA